MAEKLADVAPLAIVIDDGTLRAALLLDKPTTAPPEGAAADKDTVQVDEAPAARLVGEQESELSDVGTTSVTFAVRELPL